MTKTNKPIGKVDGRRRRRGGPKATMTFKVSRRVMRAYFWLADRERLRLNQMFAILVERAVTDKDGTPQKT